MKGESCKLRDAKAMSDMKVKDFDVNAVQALHILGVSPFFRGGATSGPFTGVNTGCLEHLFGRMSTYQRYGDPSNPDSLLYCALATLEEILRSILAEIENKISDPEIKMLATTMLSRSEKFICDLLQFMTDTYLEYMGLFGESDRTWNFVCECVERILTTEFCEAKSLVTGMDFSEPDFNIKMICCSSNVCTAQEKFLEVGIANHPVLSFTISCYLIKNTSAGNVDSIRSTVTSHTSTIDSMESGIAELRNQVRSAASVVDKATSALKKLEKQEPREYLNLHQRIEHEGNDRIVSCWSNGRVGILERVGKSFEEKGSKAKKDGIQGSYEFVSNTIKLARLYNFTIYTSAIVGSTKQQIKQLREDDTLTWCTLTHSRVGGLMKGKFSVASNVELDKSKLYKKSQTSPKLGGILKCTEDGTGVDESDLKDLSTREGYLLQNSLVRFGEKNLKVIAPSVFLGGLCKRKVTDGELMNVYVDMNVAVQDKLLKNAAGLEESLSRTFVNQVPGKVCYKLGLSVLESLSNTKLGPTTVGDIGGIDKNCDLLRKDVHKQTFSDLEKVIKPSEATLVETVDLPLENSAPIDPNLKAAKNDDARANEEEWNVRAGCVFDGGYQKDKHEKPFEMMRQTCLCWYQKRVRKSFLKYLRLTYRDDWEILAHGRYIKNLSGSKRKRDGNINDGADKVDSLSTGIDYDQYLQDIEEEKKSGRKSSEMDSKRDELIRDLKVGRDAILQAGGSSWWEWDAGSTLFFWRWPEEYKKDVRDGLEVCIEGQLPEYWARQNWPLDPQLRESN